MIERGKILGLAVFFAVMWAAIKFDEHRCNARQTKRMFKGNNRP